MFKKNILIAFLLINAVSFSQEIVNSIPIELKRDSQVFQSVDETSKELTLFIADKLKTKAIRLDAKMNIIDSLSASKSEKNQTKIIGNITGVNKTTLFFGSSNPKKITSQSFDFDSKAIIDKTFDLDIKDEIYLEKFSVNNTFIILHLVKSTNAFKLYVFDSAGNYDVKNIATNELKFYHRSNLYDTFADDFLPFEPSFSLQKISPESPTSLTDSAKKRKCYYDKKKIIITIDTNNNFTQLINIDLEKYIATGKIIKNTPYKSFNTTELNSNSFLMEDNLYQIKTSSTKSILSIKDLEDNLIKEYEISANKSIDFKNSDIIQQNGSAKSTKTIDETGPFIRKINNLNLGVSLYKINDKYFTTLGSVSEVRDSGPAVGGMFGVVGVLMYYALSNPTLENFNAYANRKVVYFNSLLDKNGNHVKEDLKPLAFDKIQSFMMDKKDITSQTIFKINESYYLGYYENKLQKFSILKFTD
jgi:hypothetical protein